MKIAIISGHFIPQLGYQEVNWAGILSRLGHDVCVFTSGEISPSSKMLLGGPDLKNASVSQDETYMIVRLKTLVSFGSNIVCSGLREAVKNFNPDIALVFGFGKLFPVPLYRKGNEYKILTFFGENSDMSVTLKKKAIIRLLYPLAVKKSHKVILNTRSTKNILKDHFPPKKYRQLRMKAIDSSLGFDSRIFFFDNAERKKIRNQYNIEPNEKVFITSTRITKHKNIKKQIDLISDLHNQGFKIKYFIIGFLNDEYDAEIKKYILSKKNRHIYFCLPFMSQNELNKHYSAADIGWWTRAAISIQQSMGTGLPLLIEYKDSVSHLVTNSVNGWTYSPDTLKSTVFQILENESTHTDRTTLEKFNQRFSYECIINRILESKIDSTIGERIVA